jgi:Uma2 family endonuclease
VPYTVAMDLHASAEPGPFTWDDFVCLEEDDLRELIDGDLVKVEVPRQKHEHVVAMLAMFLGVWARGRGHRVLASGYKVKISGKRGFMPDLQVFRAENRADREQQEGLVHGHPDLVVEVLSPSSARYDRVTKLGGYASIGVPEYWIVDPEARTVERLVLKAEGFVIAEGLADAEVFRPASFEGLEIPMGELWESS